MPHTMKSSAHTDTSTNTPQIAVPAFASIAEHLDHVRRTICDELVVPPGAPELEPLLEQIRRNNGKMIRPGLVLLSGSACGRIMDDHVRTAAVLELIHTATLLHDDVIDEGRTRRGKPTVNSRWGNESAVLLGDFLLGRVFRMGADLPDHASRQIADAAIEVCMGELRQVAHKQDLELQEQQYLDIIANKSASLFRTCCSLGASLAGARPEQTEALGQFGLNAGIAFQITDDVLDIVGDEDRTGKTLGSDAVHNKLTLPLIHLIATAENGIVTRVRDILHRGPESKTELRSLLQHHGSLDYARSKSRSFIDRAVQSLSVIAPSQSLAALEQTAAFLCDRLA